MTTATATVTDGQAEQVRDAIAALFGVDPAYGPTLMEEGWDDVTGRVIVWEGDPYAWPQYVPYGGTDWESGHEFSPIKLPDGVRIEAINHYSIAVYPA
ncbi:hypothetical protein [Streptosporangium canum]|uniref:hypothetical protein n=1 Tax=Streptosporangium canum TaxID=324952 RepID=UPI00379B4A90